MNKMSKYTDPPNTPELLEKLRTLKTLGEVKPIIEETFPEWIVGSMPQYSTDYPHLQKNWQTICHASGVTPLHIVAVDDIVFDEKHTLVRSFAELMTRAGFAVRRKDEFFPCASCGAALAQPHMYDAMKKAGVPVPSRWSSICENC